MAPQPLAGAVHAALPVLPPHGHGPGDLAGHHNCQGVPRPQRGVPAQQYPHPYLGEMGVRRISKIGKYFFKDFQVPTVFNNRLGIFV